MRCQYWASFMASSVLFAPTAYGQEQGAAHHQLEEIIVTAQKRETRLEKTPMTINVIGGEQLQAAGVKEIKDIQASVPGLIMNESPGGLPGVSVRGIGTSPANQLFEQSVGLFVDGVYHPRNRQYRDALFDVERVEVIKGSQGVLFGKNTSVGAISVISRRPGAETGGYAQIDHELNYNSTSIEGGLDLRANEDFAVRLSGNWNDVGGYVRNVTKDRWEQSGKNYVVRAVADWNITPQFSALAKLQWGRSNMVGNPYEYVRVGAAPAPDILIDTGILDGGLKNYVKYEDIGNDLDTIDYQRNFDPSLILKYEFDNGYSITSTTGYSRYTFRNGFDSDASPLDMVANTFRERFHQRSQEVRLNSPTTGAVDFVVGAIYLESRSEYDTLSYFRDFAAGPFSLTGAMEQQMDQKTKTHAVFANANWRFAEGLTLSIGGRYSVDKKKAVYQKSLADDLGDPTNVMGLLIGTGASKRGRNTDKTFDFSGTLSYAVTPSATLYASVGRGNKGAGFNNQASVSVPLPSPFITPREVVTSYEIGLKGRFLDGRAYASIAGFILDVKDMQDSYFDSTVPGFVTRSIDAKTRGIEAEAQVRVAGPLTLFGNLSWLPTAKDAAGDRLQRAPKFTYTAGVRGDEDISSDLNLGGSIMLNHSSNYLHQPYSTPGDYNSQAFTLLNARMDVTHKPSGITIFAAAHNITKERYRAFAFGSLLGLGTVGAWNEPRTITMGARVNF